jgi:transcriptional regulator with XRE-family HTH domain
MNFSQLHERLRLEITRRAHRGLLTQKLLAAQTGLKPSHISNFLHRKRRLSLAALDRLLAAQALSVEDLLPAASSREPLIVSDSEHDSVPLVSHSAAMQAPVVTPIITVEVIQIPAGILDQLRPRRTLVRREWQRFVAVRVTPEQALAMTPVLAPHAIVVIDRHYNSLAPYQPPRPNIYAVSYVAPGGKTTLLFRYASFDANRMILRPHAIDHPVELMNVNQDASPSDCIVGRVCVCISQL